MIQIGRCRCCSIHHRKNLSWIATDFLFVQRLHCPGNIFDTPLAIGAVTSSELLPYCYGASCLSRIATIKGQSALSHCTRGLFTSTPRAWLIGAFVRSIIVLAYLTDWAITKLVIKGSSSLVSSHVMAFTLRFDASDMVY